MLVNPKAVCVDAEGRLLVVESHVRRLHLFDWYSERARPINRLELGETLDFPVHLAVNNRLGRFTSPTTTRTPSSVRLLGCAALRLRRRDRAHYECRVYALSSTVAARRPLAH